MKQKHIYIGIIVLIIIIIIIYISSVAIQNSAKRKAELEKIQAAIRENITKDGTSISGALIEVEPDLNFNALPVVTAMKEAQGGWFSTDNDDVIFDSLSNKTKAQIKSIDIAFQNKYGMSLDTFLKDFFGELVDYDKYERALTIINSAK